MLAQLFAVMAPVLVGASIGFGWIRLGLSYPTEFVTQCARDNDFISLEDAHWKLSTFPAMAAGFRDRGFLQVGAPADILVYDLEALGLQPLELLHDLPGGDWRRVRRGVGYKTVMVNGQVTLQDDEPVANDNAGRLLRHGVGAESGS